MRPAPAHRASAVLAPLYEHEGETWVVLTRRAGHLRNHRHEVSLPGGRQDNDETLIAAALREVYEEIALDPRHIDVVAELDHLMTFVSRSAIVPYVGTIDHRPVLVPSPDEVEHVLHVPLSELLDPEVFREERWGLGPIDRPIYFFELVGDTVWGATGAILVDLLGRVVGARTEPGM